MNQEEMFKPMCKYIPKDLWEDLMFMGKSDEVFLYKHYFTRRYINVDKQGRFYGYTGNNDVPYVEIKTEEAIYHLDLI